MTSDSRVMIKTTSQIQIRERAIHRGLDFIYRFGRKASTFDDYGSFLTFCLALTGATSRDPQLRESGRARAEQLARRWRRAHPCLRADASSDSLLDFVVVRYALRRLGLRNPLLDNQIAIAAIEVSAADALGFDPLQETPPDDLPYTCECGSRNQRGRKFCKQCRRRLLIQTRYRVWMDALANTFVAERCGTRFGARHEEVLKWLPAMRPYPACKNVRDEMEESLHDALYAVTHLVYTLNDYGTYKLSPHWLPLEFAFLKANVESACAHDDPELLGELLESLKAFGLRSNHPLIVRGTDYLLASQNPDGSWGDPDEEDAETRCHTTWTAVDGLRAHAWRGERLSIPALKPLLKHTRSISLRQVRRAYS